jgi:hypothetical protein
MFPLSPFTFLDPQVSFQLPRKFDFAAYIDTEQELWAFFPETAGKRVNFCQLGLTARLYAEVPDHRQPLQIDETYFLMPCEDGTMRPLRMRTERILTLEEFRTTHLTAMRMMNSLSATGTLMDAVHRQVLGPELLAESSEES